MDGRGAGRGGKLGSLLVPMRLEAWLMLVPASLWTPALQSCLSSLAALRWPSHWPHLCRRLSSIPQYTISYPHLRTNRQVLWWQRIPLRGIWLAQSPTMQSGSWLQKCSDFRQNDLHNHSSIADYWRRLIITFAKFQSLADCQDPISNHRRRLNCLMTCIPKHCFELENNTSYAKI